MSHQCAKPIYLTIVLSLISHGSYQYFKTKGLTEILSARDIPDLLQLILSKVTESILVLWVDRARWA